MQLEVCLLDFQQKLIYKIVHFQMENTSEDLSHFYVFGCEAYVFLPNEVCTNKLVPCSELIIFIGYKDNGYCFICHIQGNVIFHSKYAIFDQKFFLKCTDSHVKEYKFQKQNLQCLNLPAKIDLLQYLFQFHSSLLFKMIFLLIFPLLFSLISLYLPYFLQYLNSSQ